METEQPLKESISDAVLKLAEQYAGFELEPDCDDEAFQLYKLVGEKGGPRVMCALALCYRFGWGTEKADLNTVVECYVKAARLGSVETLDQLYKIQQSHQIITCLPNEVMIFYMEAEEEEALAEFNAGYCYYYGIGMPEDIAKAGDLFQMAADQGYADAMWMLEVCRRNGVGDGYNGMKGIDLERHAAEMGSAEAQFELGYAYCNGSTTYGLDVENDNKQAVEWFEKAVDQNHTEATYYLAYCYYTGEGVQKDIKKAFQLYKKAALMGNREAQDYISDFYSHEIPGLTENKYPVGIDYYEAAHCNRKAVEQGYNLNQGIMESIGLAQDEINELVKQDSSFESSKVWYGIAKEYETGNVVEKNDQKAFKMYKLAAGLGNISAKIVLGRCYEEGIGTDVDTEQAIHWYEKAAMEGHNEAAKSLLSLIQPESMSKALKAESPFIVLAECYQTGNVVAKNEDTALLMREHAAANGDIRETRMIIEAYISGNGSEYRIKTVGSIVAKTSGLSSKDYEQFIDKFSNYIDELDKMQILEHIVTAIRAEIMKIMIVFD